VQHHEIKVHTDVVSYCAYLDNDLVVTTSYDKSIAIWVSICKI